MGEINRLETRTLRPCRLAWRAPQVSGSATGMQPEAWRGREKVRLRPGRFGRFYTSVHSGISSRDGRSLRGTGVVEPVSSKGGRRSWRTMAEIRGVPTTCAPTATAERSGVGADGGEAHVC